MKLIDKDKVAAEIEERLHKYEKEYEELARDEFLGTARKIRPKIEELKDFRSFIDNIEVKEVNLEKEIDKIWNPRFNFGWDEKSLLSINHDGFTTFAKHFYELGLRAQKGE